MLGWWGKVLASMIAIMGKAPRGRGGEVAAAVEDFP
jgi:hypothetical protein